MKETLLFEGEQYQVSRKQVGSEDWYVVSDRATGTIVETLGRADGSELSLTLGLAASSVLNEIIRTLLDGTVSKLLLLVALSVSPALHASWFCTEQASERSGNVVRACGIGTASTEQEARTHAFDAAKEEFKRVCQASDDCRYRMVTAEPKRTECELRNEYRCYRMVQFTIEQPSGDQEVAPDARPFLSKGMTKQTVARIMGIPVRTVHDWGYNRRTLWVWAGNPKCAGKVCSVQFGRKNGFVVTWDAIRPEHTSDVR